MKVICIRYSLRQHGKDCSRSCVHNLMGYLDLDFRTLLLDVLLQFGILHVIRLLKHFLI